MRILTVEDEPAILRMLERGLTAAGHQVVAADNGPDGAVLAEDETVDLVLLDISLPELDGYGVLSRIRARRPDLPVLMLTARDDLENKVRALDRGADDYLTKPFAFEELLARVRALTRRVDQASSTQIEVGDVRLDLLGRRAWRGDRVIELSNREFTLLEYLLRHPSQVLSRTQILFAVWEYDADPSSNSVDELRHNGLFGQRPMKRSAPPPTRPDWPGLCNTCRHAHRIEAALSTFWRCRLSETDERFARYPALPVLACAGHQPGNPTLPNVV